MTDDMSKITSKVEDKIKTGDKIIISDGEREHIVSTNHNGEEGTTNTGRILITPLRAMILEKQRHVG